MMIEVEIDGGRHRDVMIEEVLIGKTGGHPEVMIQHSDFYTAINTPLHFGLG